MKFLDKCDATCLVEDMPAELKVTFKCLKKATACVLELPRKECNEHYEYTVLMKEQIEING